MLCWGQDCVGWGAGAHEARHGRRTLARLETTARDLG